MIDLFQRLAPPALAALFLTAAVLSLTTNWRLRFGGLAVQYLLAAGLMAPFVLWQVAVVKAGVGVLVVVILALSGRQVNYGRHAAGPAAETPAGSSRWAALRRLEFQTNLPFRSMALLLGTVTTWYLVTGAGYAVPDLPVALNLAGMLLIVLGLLGLGLTQEPVNAGIGLLMFLNGFEVLYAPVERSLTVAALLAAINFGVALAVSHLALLRYADPEAGA